MPQIGDTVRYLNAVGGGIIVRINDNIAYVDEDGFETPVLLRECVVVAKASDKNIKTQAQPSNQAKSTTKQALHNTATNQTTNIQNIKIDEKDTEETNYGNKLTVILGIETLDIAHIGESGYEVSLVNDSNYYLYFTWLTRSDNENSWIARYAGMVEPNIQVILSELSREDIVNIEAMAVQIIAFKQGKTFEIQSPISTQIKVDNTKFFKVHCFRDNCYFDNKVLSFEIIKDGIIPNSKVENFVQAKQLENAMKAKQRIDRPNKRPVRQRKEDKNKPLVIDLHINELVDNTNNLTNADMLNLQVDTFRRIMDENLRYHGRKIVFIHGKGEGVLRQALYKELNYRYNGHDVCDASFREYGFGATQVTIR